jgi:hypothetical protein
MLVVCSVSFLDVQYASAQPSSPYAVKIPTKFGKVKERYRGTNNKVIVHIQDAHTSYEAQENIANIIQQLVKEDVVDVVAVEGAEGKVDLAPFRVFPVDDIRWQVAANMTALGYLTGAELAGIGMQEEAELFGIENMDVYYRNLDKFRTVMNKREDIIGEIEKLEEILNNLKAPMYSKDLLGFDAIVTKYYNEEINFIDFTRAVIEASEGLNIDLYEYINIALFMESLAASAGAQAEDKPAIEQERADLIYELLKVATDEKLLTLLHKLEEKTQALSQEKQLLLDSFLVKQLRGNALDEQKYSHFIKHAQFAEKFGQVDKGALLDEVEALAYVISQGLAEPNIDTREHVDLTHNLYLLKNLIELKVVPSQVETYRDNDTAYSSTRYMNFLRAQARLHNIQYRPSGKIVLLDQVMVVAAEFYRFAEARSRILVKNTLSKIKQSDASAIALVAGGYHTDGIVEALKKKGYSYLVVSPRIDNLDLTVPYMERMMNVKSTAELRFESAFNTIVKELVTHKKDNETKLVNFWQDVLSLSILAQGNKERNLSILDHPGLGKVLDNILPVWNANTDEWGKSSDAEVIFSKDNEHVYVIMGNGKDRDKPDRESIPVLVFSKNAVMEKDGNEPAFVKMMSREDIEKVKRASDLEPMPYDDVIKQAFAQVNFATSVEKLKAPNGYVNNWKALVDVVTRGMIDGTTIAEGLIENLGVAYDPAVVPYKQASQTKTIVFTAAIVKVIGDVYGKDTGEQDPLLAGAKELQAMRDNKYKNEDVDSIIRSYYGEDVDITANIEFICSEKEKATIELGFKGANQYHLTDKVEVQRAGKTIESGDKMRAIVSELVGRDDLTVIMDESEETALDSNRVVALTKAKVETYKESEVNLIGMFKAPNEVINVILQLFEKGTEIFKKVATMLADAQKKIAAKKASDTSA